MSEMVDRVARAIQAANITAADAGHTSRFSTPEEIFDAHRKLARAAIEAMRDVPDWLMMIGGNTPISNVGKAGRERKGRIGDVAAREAFERMIDAALAEKSP